MTTIADKWSEEHLESVLSAGFVFVRVASHRARERMIALLGYTPAYYFSWERSGEWAAVRGEDLERAVSVVGITRASKTHDLRRCIKW